MAGMVWMVVDGGVVTGIRIAAHGMGHGRERDAVGLRGGLAVVTSLGLA